MKILIYNMTLIITHEYFLKYLWLKHLGGVNKFVLCHIHSKCILQLLCTRHCVIYLNVLHHFIIITTSRDGLYNTQFMNMEMEE